MKFNKASYALLLALIVQCFSWAQEREVRGTVKDESGLPLGVVTVIIKGSTHGVATDFDGNYSIKVPSDKSVLVFSQIGMKTVEKTVGKSRHIDVVLREEAQELGEVVVTGVGAATDKRKVAISVDAVSEKNLKRTPVKSLDDALSGKIAGAQIQSTSGQPGQQANIILRGINSLGSSQPMVIIDGVEINTSNYTMGSNASSGVSSRLADIDLSSVERVEVIQGAAAATIYGAQGANGVIQIFTKKGKKGQRTEISVNSSLSVDDALTGNLSFAQNHYYKTKAGDGRIVDGKGNVISVDPTTGYWTTPDQSVTSVTVNETPYKEKTYNHLKQFYKTAYTQQHSVNVTGASGNVDYAIGASSLDQTSVVNGSYKKKNLTANIGAELFKGFTVRSNSQLIKSENTTGVITGRSSILSGIGTALSAPAYVDLHFKDVDGKPFAGYDKNSNAVMPFYTYEYQNTLSETNRVIQGINFNYKVTKNIELDYKYGYDHTRYDNTEFVKNQTTNRSGAGIAPYTGKLTKNLLRETLQNSLLSAYFRFDFQRDFKLKLPIQSTTQLAYDWRKNDVYEVESVGTGYGVEPPFTLRSANSSNSIDDISEFITFGYLINQKFDYANLFGLSVGVRSDYSSAFGEGGKPFTFPRADAYFRFADLLHIEKLNELKVRAAYGEAGIQPKAYDRLITLSNDKLGNRGYYYLPSISRNPELQVQTSKETEFGLDYGLRLGQSWFHRISGNVVYWKRQSFGIIYNVDTPLSLGANQIKTNAIDLSSNGIQASVDLNVLNTDDLDWNFGARFSKGETVVDKISNGKRIVVGRQGGGLSTVNERERVGTFYGYSPLSSLTQTNSAGERYIADSDLANYELVNGMVVDKRTKTVKFTNEQEKIGDATPDFTMSFFNDLTFAKKLTFSFQVDWTKGGDIYNGTRQQMYQHKTHGDLDKKVTINGTTGAYVAYYNSLYNTAKSTSYFVEDGSYVRLRNVSLSYDATDIHKDSLIKGLTLTASVRNLLTLTNYSGLDPEAVGTTLNNPLYRGIDLYTFPNMRTITFAVNLKF